MRNPLDVLNKNHEKAQPWLAVIIFTLLGIAFYWVPDYEQCCKEPQVSCEVRK